MKTFRIIIALCLLLSLMCGCGPEPPEAPEFPVIEKNSKICVSGNLVNGGLAAESGDYTYFIDSEEGYDSDGMIASFQTLARKEDGGRTETICGASGGINISGKYVYFFVNTMDTTDGMEPGIYRIEQKLTKPELLYSPDTRYPIFHQLILSGGKLYFSIDDAVMSVDEDGKNPTTIASGDGYFDCLNVTGDGTIWYTFDENYNSRAVLNKTDGKSAAVSVSLKGKNPTGVIVTDDYIYYCCEDGDRSTTRRYSLSDKTDKPLISADGYLHYNLYDGRLWYSYYDDETYVLRSCDLGTMDILDHTDSIPGYNAGLSRMCFVGDRLYYVPVGTQLETIESMPVPDAKTPQTTTVPTTTTAAPTTTEKVTTTTSKSTTTTTTEADEFEIPVFTRVSASSVLGDQLGKNYKPENLIDCDTTTAWVENASGDGIGEWVLLEADSPQTVSGMHIANGYWSRDDLYEKNSKITRLKLSFSDGSECEYNITAYPSRGSWNVILLPEPVRTTYIRIEILAAETGSLYTDTCVSEIEVF